MLKSTKSSGVTDIFISLSQNLLLKIIYDAQNNRVFLINRRFFGFIPIVEYASINNPKPNSKSKKMAFGLMFQQFTCLKELDLSGYNELGNPFAIDISFSTFFTSLTYLNLYKANINPDIMYLINLNSLNIGGRDKYINAQVLYIAGLTNLTYLNCSDAKTDRWFYSHIQTLIGLKKLVLSNLKSGTLYFSSLTNLQYLDISRNTMTLLDIGKLTNLQYLNTSCNEVQPTEFPLSLTEFICIHTDIAWNEATAISQCTNIKRLDIAHAILYVDLKFIGSLTNVCSLNLESIKYMSSSEKEEITVDDMSLQFLSSLNNLTYLDLSMFPINGACLDYLSNGSNFSGLNLSGCKFFTAIPKISEFINLRTLNLSWNSKVTDDNVTKIANLTNLTYLNLSNTAITNIDFAMTFKQLKSLYLFHTSVPQKDKEKLMSVLPYLYIGKEVFTFKF